MSNRFTEFLDWFRPDKRKSSSLEEMKLNAVISSGYFDADWYSQRAQKNFPDDRSALRHFFEEGCRSGLDPGPHFSTSGYLAANPEVARANINPLAHFVLIGKIQNRGPGIEADGTNTADVVYLVEPEFDNKFYFRQYPDIASSGFSPFSHFLNIGWRQGRNPNGSFSTKFYLDVNDDVRAAGVNPFYHYVAAGRREGRMPNPILASDETAALVRKIVGAEFDATFYLRDNPHLRGIGIDPLTHYCEVGWRSGNNPSAGFNVSLYLELHSDVRLAGVDPFFHFLSEGRKEGRALTRNVVSDSTSDRGKPESREDLETRAVLESDFDTEFYLTKYRDIREAGVDPLAHYIDTGWKENRDPSAHFSTKYYLETNPDVAAAGINPYFHYLITGRSEGRRASHPGGWKVRVLERLGSNVAQTPVIVTNHGGLLADLETFDVQAEDIWIFSLSHDNYTSSVGGIQHCINLEQVAAFKKGWRYLNFFPSVHNLRLQSATDWTSVRFGICIDGLFVGETDGASLLKFANRVSAANSTSNLVVHSLLGHSVVMICELSNALDPAERLFWLHDYFSACPSYTLLRNDIAFCGAPPPDSQACKICAFGTDRIDHLELMRTLFQLLNFRIVSPSQVALNVWRSAIDLPYADCIVHEHCTINYDDETRQSTRSGPIRIAFLGHPADHKGWNTFERLVNEFKADERYQFFHLGSSRAISTGCTFEEVSIIREGPDAMRSAIDRHRIDAAIVWSIWPETFSFVAHEAIAGGAAIITNFDSGNIAKLAANHDRSYIFQTESDLLEAFRLDGLEKLRMGSQTVDGPAGSVAFSSMSVDILAAVD